MTQPAAHHVGLTVSNLERAIEFYRDGLGFPLLDRFEVSGEAFSTVVGIENAAGTFAHLDAGAVRLEVVEYDPKADETSAELNQPGASHVGIAVDDVDAFLEGLPESVEPMSEPRTTASGTRLVFLRDPDGNLIELLET